MRELKGFLTLCCVAALLLLAVPAAVADHHERAEGEMSADEQAMMEAWKKSMTPGEQHAKLSKMTGDYELKIKSWMDPSAPPMESTATAHRDMMLGGRVLHESVKGQVMGQEFVGHGATGYDNVTGEYWSTWVDNMSTGVVVSRGNWDEEMGAMVFHGKYSDPMTGEMAKAKMVLKHGDDGSEHFAWYDIRDGEEVKTMEITYTKK